MIEQILVTQSSMPPFEEYINEIRKLWDSHWLTNMGVEHEQLQLRLEGYLGCRHVILFTNGHLALETALAAMQFQRGGEVITTPFTFASTTHAIVRNGLKPVFCDIKIDDFTIDVDKIESLISENTVAILPVHVYGNICDVDRIQKIAERRNLKVIYDAAHAFGVKYKGVFSSNFGDASMFSFHATKVFNTIEGGAVCFHDDSLVEVMNDMKNFGIKDAEHVAYVGGNAKMNEFQAAMGVCNLRHFEEEIDKRRKVYNRYMKNLDGLTGIRLSKQQSDVISNYAYFPVVFENENRENVLERLVGQGIHARKYFYPLTNSFDCYKDQKSVGNQKTPVADYVSKRVLTLPMYASLPLEEVDRICELITEK